MAESIATLVKNRVFEKGQGEILTIRDFDDNPENDIVRKTLSRLTLKFQLLPYLDSSSLVNSF